MKNILQEFIVTKKEMIEVSKELSETKELLNFSLEKQDELEKEIKGLKEKFNADLEKIEKPLYENTYKNIDVKLRKIKELVKDIKLELTQN